LKQLVFKEALVQRKNQGFFFDFQLIFFVKNVGDTELFYIFDSSSHKGLHEWYEKD